MKKYFCIDCEIKEISYNSWKIGGKRCASCAKKGELNPAYSKKGKNSPSWKGNKAKCRQIYYCINGCGKIVTKEGNRCNSCCKYIKREIRFCACNCGKSFECKINSKKRFIRGHSSRLNHPMKNKHHSEETKKKISKRGKGKLIGDKNPSKRKDVRIKISNSKKGIKNWMFGRKGELHPCFGKLPSKETRKKMSLSGGGTGIPYEKKTLSRSIRESKKYIKWKVFVFKRDNYICQNCKIKKENRIISSHFLLFLTSF